MLRVFFGQHKCASKWVTLLIERICNEMGWKSCIAYRARINGHGSLERLLQHEQPDFLIIPESDHGMLQEIQGPFKGFHVIRDPRDLVVSGYFSHLKVHELTSDISQGVTAGHREQLQALPKDQGLDLEIATIARVPLQHLYEWDYRDPRIWEVKFEQLTTDPHKEFSSILSFLAMEEPKNDLLFAMQCYTNRLLKRAGLPRFRAHHYSRMQMRKTLRDLSFENLRSGRPWWLNQKGAHYREGKAGNWREHLDARHEQAIVDAFPGILENLGYEPASSFHT